MESQPVSIRLAENIDHSALIRCAATKHNTFDVDHWRQHLATTGYFTYLAEQDEIFGFVTAGPNPLLSDGSGEILGVFVAPNHRGRGYGKKLLVRGLTVLKRRGFDRAIIFLAEPDDAATKILDSLGFERADLERNQAEAVQTGYGRDLFDYF